MFYYQSHNNFSQVYLYYHHANNVQTFRFSTLKSIHISCKIINEIVFSWTMFVHLNWKFHVSKISQFCGIFGTWNLQFRFMLWFNAKYEFKKSNIKLICFTRVCVYLGYTEKHQVNNVEAIFFSWTLKHKTSLLKEIYLKINTKIVTEQL